MGDHRLICMINSHTTQVCISSNHFLNREYHLLMRIVTFLKETFLYNSKNNNNSNSSKIQGNLNNSLTTRYRTLMIEEARKVNKPNTLLKRTIQTMEEKEERTIPLLILTTNLMINNHY